MERISRELVEEGIDNELILFGVEDDQLAAYIGDYWFFVTDELGTTEDDYSPEELTDLVYEAINDEPINSDDEDEATESLYYKYFLEERLEV